jgi:NTP pyrophosphatase (non-canonical NTP hydrolase)
MNNNLSFQEAIKLAENIIERFEKIEGKKWGAEGSLIELQKQVGELSREIMVNEGYYFSGMQEIDKKYEPNKERIAGELADIFYATIRLARHYNIDLEKAHIDARKEEEVILESKGV